MIGSCLGIKNWILHDRTKKRIYALNLIKWTAHECNSYLINVIIHSFTVLELNVLFVLTHKIGNIGGYFIIR